MFTGLIKDIGVVRSIQDFGADRRLIIETQMSLHEASIGGSIACSGCCLTVSKIENNCFYTDVSAETLTKTIIKFWATGTRINIEPSLRLGDEMGGHIVSGHVDGLAVLKSITPEGMSYRLWFEVPHNLSVYIASKGSVTLDGISLTVNEVQGAGFGVNIVPHTWSHTTLADRQIGDHLNLEIDMLARYVARYLEQTRA